MELRLRRSPGWPVLLNMMKQKLLGNQLVAGHSSTDALYCKSQLSIKCPMNCLGGLLQSWAWAQSAQSIDHIKIIKILSSCNNSVLGKRSCICFEELSLFFGDNTLSYTINGQIQFIYCSKVQNLSPLAQEISQGEKSKVLMPDAASRSDSSYTLQIIKKIFFSQ